jgi:tetrahydromethanopterin:alpha-L-glutamate ligase
MMKLGIAVTDVDDWTARAFIESSKRIGIEPVIINLSDTQAAIDKGQSYKIENNYLTELDALVIRDMGAGENEATTFRFDTLRQLENEGVLVVNSPSAIQNAANKYHSTYLFSKAGIQIPDTKVVQDTNSAMDILEDFGDSILKPVFGYKGIGISRVKDGNVIRSDGSYDSISIDELVNSIIKTKGMAFIQKFIENPGRDIRAFVVDGKVIGAIYRKAIEGGWLNNLSQGGSAERCVLSPEQEDICKKAAQTTGTLFAGVDLIEGKDSTYVLEINATPSGAGIYRSWNIDVTEKIIDSILKRL